MAVKIDMLAEEINKCLADYTDEVEDALKDTTKHLAEEAVSELKSNSPKKTGKYARGWSKRQVGEKYIVHNRRYQLTHLLEKGHAKKGGGRVAARVHIKPVEDSIFQKAVDKFKVAMK